MAEITWPYSIAEVIVTDATVGFADNTRRTEFESGLIAQKRTVTEPMFNRQLGVRVLHHNYPAFREWLKENGHRFFNFRDTFLGEDLMHEVRIQGGAGAVQLQRSNDYVKGRFTGPGGVTLTTPQDAKYWSGQVTFEGFI